MTRKNRLTPASAMAALVALTLLICAIVGVAADLFTPVRSTILALAVLLLPAGIGFLVLPSQERMCAAGMRRIEQLLLAYFVGLVTVMVVFVARERYGTSGPDASDGGLLVLDLAFLGLSGLGWWRALRTLNHTAGIGRFLKTAVLCLPLFVIPYMLGFFVFSRFPLTELFQFTHIMKGAEEFARFDRLNPFTADSYPPLFQATAGLCLRLTGGTFLDVIWLGAFPAYLLRLAAFYALATRLFDTYRGELVFIALTVPTFGFGLPTNGDLSIIGTVLIMSLVAGLRTPPGEGHPLRRWIAAVAITAWAGLNIVALQAGPGWLSIGLLAGLLAMNALSAQRSSRVGAGLLVALAVSAVSMMHRSSMLFIPLGTMLIIWLRFPPAPSRPIRVLGVAFPLAAAILAGKTLFEKFRSMGTPSPPDADLVLNNPIHSLADNYREISDAALGAGSTVALFEVARAIGPLLMILALACYWPHFRRALASNASGEARRINAAWIAAFGLLTFMLIGLPFTHRAIFLAKLMLGSIVAYQVCRLDVRGTTAVGIAIGLYAALLAALEYGISESTGISEEIITRAQPILVATLLLALTLAGIARWHTRWAFQLLPVILIVLTCFESGLIRYHFLSHSYAGAPAPARSEPFSHYARQDVELARWVRAHFRDALVVSDPFTMAIVRALAGVDSVVTFSNLDTLSQASEDRLRQYLGEIINANEWRDQREACGEWSELRQRFDGSNTAELGYRLARASNPEATGSEVLGQLGYLDNLRAVRDPEDWENGVRKFSRRPEASAPHDSREQAVHQTAIRVVVVINARTIDWLRTRTPSLRTQSGQARELDPVTSASLQTRCNATLPTGNNLVLEWLWRVPVTATR